MTTMKKKTTLRNDYKQNFWVSFSQKIHGLANVECRPLEIQRSEEQTWNPDDKSGETQPNSIAASCDGKVSNQSVVTCSEIHQSLRISRYSELTWNKRQLRDHYLLTKRKRKSWSQMVHNCFSSISSYQRLIKSIKPQILRVSTISRFLFQFSIKPATIHKSFSISN